LRAHVEHNTHVHLTRAQVEAWKQLVPHIHRVMELGANHQRMQHFAVAVLVNTPQGCAHHFRIDCTSVDSLIDFLRRQFEHPEYECLSVCLAW
jgi:hypothetical protein